MEHIFKIIKRNSKGALKSHWISAIAIVLVFCGINLLFTILDTILSVLLNIPGFLSVVGATKYFMDNSINTSFPAVFCTLIISLTYFFVMAPLNLGICNWFYSLTGGKNLDISSVFIFFDSVRLILKAWALNISIFIRMSFWFIVYFSIPTGLKFLMGYIYADTGGALFKAIYTVSNLCCLVLYVIAAFAVMITYTKYFLAPFLIMENRNISSTNAIRLSAQITKGQRQNIFAFRMSFLGWIILCVFLAPILYVMPYYLTSSSLYGRVIISQWKAQHPEDVIFGENINAFEDIPEYWEVY